MTDKPSGSVESDKKQNLSLTAVIFSVIAAMFGVQNHKKHERDFQHGDPLQFIVVGVIFVAVFVLTLIWVVELILQN